MELAWYESLYIVLVFLAVAGALLYPYYSIPNISKEIKGVRDEIAKLVEEVRRLSEIIREQGKGGE